MPELHDTVTYPDERVGEVFLSEEAIARRVAELGADITRDYEGRQLLLISVLRGALFFMADLARSIDLSVEMDFLAISSYTEEHSQMGAKAIRFLKDLDQPIKDKNVLVVEDMIDSGLTLTALWMGSSRKRFTMISVNCL